MDGTGGRIVASQSVSQSVSGTSVTWFFVFKKGRAFEIAHAKSDFALQRKGSVSSSESSFKNVGSEDNSFAEDRRMQNSHQKYL